MGLHTLEEYYGLTATELMDAIEARFRLKVAVGGAVAEYQMQKHVERLDKDIVVQWKSHDTDGHPDFSIFIKGRTKPILAECKNARNGVYRKAGIIKNYKVEFQKTRASKEDPISRSYGFDQFKIVGVCLGNRTGIWSDFMFIRTIDLPCQPNNSNKIQIMNRVPLIGGQLGNWSQDLGMVVGPS